MQPVDIEPILAPAIFALGLSFGSFLNVCIYRLPRAQSVVTPRSACPRCGDLIPLYHNIPVLSWLILRGKCRACKQPISPRYLAIELATGLLFLACYSHFGLSLATLKCIVLGYLLLGLIFTDAETKLLPDAMTLPGLAVGILFSLVVPVNDLASRIIPGMVSPALRSEISWRIWSLSDSLLGAAVGASFLYGAAAIYLRARGVEGMGFGDVKLMAMIGAFLGTKLTVLTIFTASLAGSLFGLTTIFAVWIKRLRRIRAHAAHHSAPIGPDMVSPALASQDIALPSAASAETASPADPVLAPLATPIAVRLSPRRRAWQSARLALRFYEMPFGVFLGGMALFSFVFGNRLLHWYWRAL
ncbi:MAG TPA: prepilin peptidase [Terriglobales bacterium]|jgi:leader peptidase (prepilin peptidase)/N-methyltransferase|nr:prepilin peptidase [Terriglobales bacterium]